MRLLFDVQVAASSTPEASEFDSLSIASKHLSKEWLEHLHRAVDHHTWVVTPYIDKYKPEWLTDSIGYNIYDYGGFVVSGYDISFRPKGLDKLSKRGMLSENNPLLFEISYNGQTTLCFDNSCSIGLGDCGGNIAFPLESLCDFTFKCLDAAGNYGYKSLDISVFTKRTAEPIRIHRRDSNK